MASPKIHERVAVLVNEVPLPVVKFLICELPIVKIDLNPSNKLTPEAVVFATCEVSIVTSTIAVSGFSPGQA